MNEITDDKIKHFVNFVKAAEEQSKKFNCSVATAVEMMLKFAQAAEKINQNNSIAELLNMPTGKEQ